MAVQQIQLRRGDLQLVAQEHVRDPSGKCKGIHTAPGEKQLAMLAEVIVHGRVEHIPLQPVPCRLPDLTDQECLRLHGLHRLAEGTPEAVIHLAGHIQPPAVNVKLPYPVGSHLTEIVLHLPIGGIQLGHHPLVGKAGIVGVDLRGFGALYGEFQAVEPGAVFGLLLIADHVLKGEEVPAAVVENDGPASCTVDGSYDEVVYCSVCNEELSREGKVHTAPGHTAGEPVKENEVFGNCIEGGSYDEVVYCTVCDAELSRNYVKIEVGEHKHGPVMKENIVEATCTTAGSYDEVIYCLTCNAEISRTAVVVPAKAHTPGKTVVENKVSATCSIPSSYDTVVYCTVCGEEISRQTITGTTVPHTKGTPVKENVVEAKCTTPGSYDNVFYCIYCDAEMDRVTVTTGVKGHTIVEDKAVEPTCDKEGKTLGSHCSVCGEIIVAQIIVPAPGHTIIIRPAKAPTCTNTGLTEGSYCGVCKKEIVLQEEIPALGHTDEDGDGICDIDGRDVNDMTPDDDSNSGITVTPDADGDGYIDANECDDCGREHINFFSSIICFFIRIMRLLGIDIK